MQGVERLNGQRSYHFYDSSSGLKIVRMMWNHLKVAISNV